MASIYFQDHMKHNSCWGCGSSNEHGLKIKSYWDGDETVCIWQPKPYHHAVPETVLIGGLICTIMDCHSICTAIAHAYREEGRDLKSEPIIWYVTGGINVSFLKPTPMGGPVKLRATIKEVKGKKTIVSCNLTSFNELCATSEVTAVRVETDEWFKVHG